MRFKLLNCYGFNEAINGARLSYGKTSFDNFESPEEIRKHAELMKIKMRGDSCWNRGLTKENSEKIKNISEEIHQRYLSGELKPTFKGKKHTEETIKKISNNMKGNNNNDVTKTGRGKKGYYKGFYCSSTYELAFVIYCLDNKIKIEPCSESFNYNYKGKEHKYFPDFVINGDEIIEIKGFWTELVDIKGNSVIKAGKKYKILYPKDMSFVFDYIEKTYNKKVDKNLEDLYN